MVYKFRNITFINYKFRNITFIYYLYFCFFYNFWGIAVPSDRFRNTDLVHSIIKCLDYASNQFFKQNVSLTRTHFQLDIAHDLGSCFQIFVFVHRARVKHDHLPVLRRKLGQNIFLLPSATCLQKNDW